MSDAPKEPISEAVTRAYVGRAIVAAVLLQMAFGFGLGGLLMPIEKRVMVVGMEVVACLCGTGAWLSWRSLQRVPGVGAFQHTFAARAVLTLGAVGIPLAWDREFDALTLARCIASGLVVMWAVAALVKESRAARLASL